MKKSPRIVEMRIDLIYDHSTGIITQVIDDCCDVYSRGIVVPTNSNQHLSDMFQTDFSNWNYFPKENESIIEIPNTRGWNELEHEETIRKFIEENGITV